MLSFKEYLNVEESFDTRPAKTRREMKGRWNVRYHFSINDLKYVIDFIRSSARSNEYELAFALVDPANDMMFNITDTGHQHEVLITVFDSIKDFLKFKPDTIRINFSASKRDSKSRGSVYGRLVKRFIPSDWEYEIKDRDREIYFELKKRFSEVEKPKSGDLERLLSL